MKLYENMLVDVLDKSRLIREKYGETSEQFYSDLDKLIGNRRVHGILSEMYKCSGDDLRLKLENIWLEDSDGDFEKTMPMNTGKGGGGGARIPSANQGVSPEARFQKVVKLLKNTPSEAIDDVEKPINRAKESRTPENIQWDPEPIRAELNDVTDRIISNASGKFTPQMSFINELTTTIDTQVVGLLSHDLRKVKMSDGLRANIDYNLRKFHKKHLGNIQLICKTFWN